MSLIAQHEVKKGVCVNTPLQDAVDGVLFCRTFSKKQSILCICSIGSKDCACNKESDGKKKNPEYLTLTLMDSCDYGKLWVAFCWRGLALVPIEGRTTQYKVPLMKHFYAEENSLFLDDNIPSIGVTEWFNKHSSDVNHM